MNTQRMVESAVKIVSSLPEVAGFMTAEPQAMVMPFAREHQKKYLVLVVFLAEQIISLDNLAPICSAIVDALTKQPDEWLEGVEVMPCVTREGRTQRILRLSVLSTAVANCKNLKADDLKKPVPFEGCTCIIYLKDLKP